MNLHAASPSTRQAPPLPELRNDIKGVYVSSHALTGAKWRNIVNLLQNTELNAVVIDVKNDYGRITYPSQVETAKALGSDANAKVRDMGNVIKTLKQQGIYTIARIVTFKDPYAVSKKTEWAIRTKSGAVWKNKKGLAWLDPYKEETWRYNIDLAKEAIGLGFDEVQFDYVRFPEQVGDLKRNAAFANDNGETKDQIIQRFLRTASQEIHAVGGRVSADVFGLTTTTKNGMGIGQKWELLVQEVDVVSPMIYPSHYATGSYGVKHPDLRPYTIVSMAVKDARARSEALKRNGEHAAQIRPWLQQFTATWVHPHQKYGKEEVREQIRALKEQGIHQYLLWNANCNYAL
ncbi:putative glycoside hydrolase [Paenibacillus sp.]|uniref:putative glycoside hydrolase n=1 Tax=Paenibacillus sp. TaxID=58172 RepID=UPI002D549409|nr:putative glycoside hydrolase [Paenibacillus sp.]HZG87270.1 putative glycoside hydrolase [Paenibacillus sp.]